MKALDLIGKKFEKLTVKKRVQNSPANKTKWECECECGETTIVFSTNLTRGHTKSCGCEKGITHNSSRTRLYRIWGNMKNRCNSENRKNYKERGITVTETWNSFKSFKEWALNNGYLDTLTIDRINNDGNYEPSNCRWTTVVEQARNTRRSVFNEELVSVAKTMNKYGLGHVKIARALGVNSTAVKFALSNRGHWRDVPCLPV